MASQAQALKLSIIIVSYNCKRYLIDCLQSIETARLSSPHEIIVVDNASSDGGVDEAARRFPGVIFVRNSENDGFARANNQGMRMASGEYVLLLNNDTSVRPGTIDAMISHLDEDPSLGAIGCALEEEDGKLQVSFGRMIGFRNEFYQKYFSELLFSMRRRLFGLRIAYPHWVSGAFLLSRRALLLDVGMLDENFFMYTEEVDLCERIRQRGYRICYDPNWRIVHYGGKSTEHNRAKAGIEYRRSQLYFYTKHYGPLRARLLRFYLLMRSVVAIAAAQWRRDPELLELRRKIYRTVRDYRIAATGGTEDDGHTTA